MYRDSTAKTASLGEDVEQLINADLNETQAVGIATVFDNKLTTATKPLAEKMELLGESLSSEIRDLRTEIRDTRTELKADIQGANADTQGVKADIQGVKADIQGVKADLRDISSARRSDRMIIIVMGFGFLGLIATLIGTPFL